MLGYFPARLEQRPSSKSQLFPFSCKQFLVKSSQIPPEGLVDHLKASHAEKNSTARPRVKSIGLCGTEISERLRWNSSTFYAAADILSAYISSRWTQRVRVDSLVVQVVNPYIFVFSYDNTRHCLKRKSKELRRRRSLTYFRGRTKNLGLKISEEILFGAVQERPNVGLSLTLSTDTITCFMDQTMIYWHRTLEFLAILKN